MMLSVADLLADRVEHFAGQAALIPHDRWRAFAVG
jgi:hypothetical protein